MEIKYKYNAGDSISAERITGWAGKLFEKGYLRKGSVTLKKFEFFLSAVCIQNIPVTSKKIVDKVNIILEGLKGHKIYGQAINNTRIMKVTKTAGHTHWQTTLQNNAYCVINTPIKSRQNF